MNSVQEVQALEIDLLLEGVFRHFSVDFRGYRREPLMNKLLAFMREAGIDTISSVQERVLHDAAMATRFLLHLGGKPAALFDDPAYFQALRAVLVPRLRSCPTPRIWIAECASAEEVFSVAILLHEENLYQRSQIFATAANGALLEQLPRASFNMRNLARYDKNYRASGGLLSLDEHVRIEADTASFLPHLQENIIWAEYNLGTDASFNEFELIVCRNVLGDFSMPLRRRSLQIFRDSLTRSGLLSINDAELSESVSAITGCVPVAEGEGLYRKIW